MRRSVVAHGARGNTEVGGGAYSSWWHGGRRWHGGSTWVSQRCMERSHGRRHDFGPGLMAAHGAHDGAKVRRRHLTAGWSTTTMIGAATPGGMARACGTQCRRARSGSVHLSFCMSYREHFCKNKAPFDIAQLHH